MLSRGCQPVNEKSYLNGTVGNEPWEKKPILNFHWPFISDVACWVRMGNHERKGENSKQECT
jgi:hypothetical protein